MTAYLCRGLGVVLFLASAGSGWGLYVSGRHRGGNAALIAALVGLSSMALMPMRIMEYWPVTASSENHGLRIAAHGEPSTVDAVIRSASNADKAFISSIRMDSKIYHIRGGCAKYLPLTKYVRGYDTREEAEADGKKPCSFCIGRLVEGVASVSE